MNIEHSLTRTHIQKQQQTTKNEQRATNGYYVAWNKEKRNNNSI